MLGMWSIASSILNLLQIASLGADGAVLSIVAAEVATSSRREAGRVVRTAVGMVLTSAVVPILLLGLWSRQLLLIIGLDHQEAFSVGVLTILVGVLSVFVMIVRVAEASASAIGRIDMVNTSRAVARVLGFGVTVVLVSKGFGLYGFFLGSVALYLCQFAACVYASRKVFPLFVFVAPALDLGVARRIWSIGSWLAGGTVLGMVVTPINRFLLARFCALEAVPVYDIAYNGCMQLRGVFETGLRALVPAVSAARVKAAGGGEGAGVLVTGAWVLLGFVALPLWLMAWLVAPLGLRGWLGGAFVPEVVPTFRVMLAASGVSLFSVPLYYAVIGFGESRAIAIASLIQVTVTVGFAVGWVVVAGRSSLVGISSAVLLGNAGLAGYLLFSWWQHIDGAGRAR